MKHAIVFTLVIGAFAGTQAALNPMGVSGSVLQMINHGLSTGALFARNLWAGEFGGRIAFSDLAGQQMTWTGDRTEFLGNLGSYTRPAALERIGLTPRVEAGVDPCAVLQFVLWLQPDETKEITFLIGQGADREDADRLISHFKNIQNVEIWE